MRFTAGIKLLAVGSILPIAAVFFANTANAQAVQQLDSSSYEIPIGYDPNGPVQLLGSGISGALRDVSIYAYPTSTYSTSSYMLLYENGSNVSAKWCMLSSVPELPYFEKNLITYRRIATSTDNCAVATFSNTGYILSSDKLYEIAFLLGMGSRVWGSEDPNSYSGGTIERLNGPGAPDNAFEEGSGTLADMYFTFGTGVFGINEEPNPTSTTPTAGFWASLFVPSAGNLYNFTGLKDAIQNKPPFGYVSSIITALSTLSTSTTSTIDLSSLSGASDVFDTLKTFASGLIWLVVAFWVFRKFRHIEL